MYTCSLSCNSLVESSMEVLGSVLVINQLFEHTIQVYIMLLCTCSLSCNDLGIKCMKVLGGVLTKFPNLKTLVW